MTATYKILVYKETGKLLINERPHLADDERPAPPDAVFVPLLPDNAVYDHYCVEPPPDTTHVDFKNIRWDFATSQWIEAYNPPPVNLDTLKHVRDNWLRDSDMYIVQSHPDHVEGWKTHRHELRTMFEDLHETIEISAKFTGYISGNTLTVTAVAEGTLTRAMHVEGAGVADDSHILLHSDHNPELTGNGATGTYHIEPSQTVGSAGAPVSLEGFNYSTVIFPRTPRDIQALKDKAAAGDLEAQEIVQRDGL